MQELCQFLTPGIKLWFHFKIIEAFKVTVGVVDALIFGFLMKTLRQKTLLCWTVSCFVIGTSSSMSLTYYEKFCSQNIMYHILFILFLFFSSCATTKFIFLAFFTNYKFVMHDLPDALFKRKVALIGTLIALKYTGIC